MTLPASGAITMAQIATELGISQTGLSLNDSRVRTLAGISSGAISFNSLHGKANLNATGNSATGSASSINAGGTVSCQPSVTASGTGTITYSWSFTSNANSCTLANASNAACIVAHTFTKNTSGSATAVLQCVVSNGSATQTVSAQANLSWNSGQ